MKKCILTLLMGAAISYGQTPQIPLTGNMGAGGSFPAINSPAVVFASDANHTMAFPEMSGSSGVIVVTSSTPLTATRNLIVPLTKGFNWQVQNSTTGGQSIVVIGASGTGVTIPNGATANVHADGTNIVSVTATNSLSITGPCPAGGTGSCAIGSPGSAADGLAGKDTLTDVAGHGWQERIGTGPASTLCTAANIGTSECPGGGGGLTGQTPTFLPTSTSTTASSRSSSFFDTVGGSPQSGVMKAFSLQQTANQCNYPGSFVSCNYVNITDDGSSPDGARPGSVTGFHTRFNAWGGGGAGKAGGEYRVTLVNNDQESYSGIAHAGIKQIHTSGMSMFGIGDEADFYHQTFTEGGLAYPSDQGIQNFLWLEQNQGHFFATIGGGTNTQPTFSSSTGCYSPLSYACAPSPGAWMIDTTTALAAGKGTSTQVPSAFGQLYSVATDQTTIPASAVYGTALSIDIAPAGNGWDDPQPTSITIGAGGGTGTGSFSVGDHACVYGIGTGAANVEQNIISAVSGSAGAQTITLPLSQPQHSVAVFKGDCMYMSFDADEAKGIRYAIPAVSIDGIHILYAYPSFGGMSVPTFFPQAGTTFANFDGGAKSGFHLYGGARVLKVGSTRPGFQPFAADAIQVWLEPSSSFGVGDTVEGTNFHAQKVDGLELRAGMANAATSNGTLTGLGVNIRGYGANGSAAALKITNEQTIIDSSMYGPGGGTINEPQFMTGGGWFNSLLTGDYTPLTNGFYFNQHQPGQTSYGLWRDPSWGSLSLDNSSTFNFNSAAIHADGSIGTNGVVNALIGLTSGYGDGAGNGAGISFSFPAVTGNTPTWLAPCSDKPLATQPSGLCVTSQGSSRSSWIAAPDRDLSAANLIGATSVSAPLGSFQHVTSSNTAAGSNLFGGSTSAGTSNAPTVFGSPNAQTVAVQGTNTGNNRSAFTFQGKFGGTLSDLFEFGTDIGQDGTKNFYVYDYTNGRVVLQTDATTDAVAFTASPTVPTASPGDNSTKAASTAFVLANSSTLGGTPTGVAGAAAGTSPTIAVSGLDATHSLAITTGTSPGTGTLVTVTFGTPRGHTSACTFSPQTAATAALTPTFYLLGGSGSYTFSTTVALTASTAYTWNVTCP